MLIDRTQYYFHAHSKGGRIDNIPETGTMTGRIFYDFHGCWYEYKTDKGCFKWIIGEYPPENEVARYGN